MPVHNLDSKLKLFAGSYKVKKGYIGNNLVYSAGNIVTYHVDSGIVYQEEFDEGESVLSPKTFTPSKSGWVFVGWRTDSVANGTVLANKVVRDDPVALYAVFKRAITVTYYDNSTTASTASDHRYYNNGNIINPSFTLTQASKSGWIARGWSTSNVGNAHITYNNGASFTIDYDVTLYGLYGQNITLTTVVNRIISKSNGARYYAPSGYINPAFTVPNPVISGATFLGWSSSSDSTTVSNSSIVNLSLSDSAARYAVFKYADATETSANGTYVTATSKTMTLHELDTTKYESHTVTAAVTRLLTSNDTAGRIDNYVYIDSRLVRQTSAPVGGTTTNEIGNPLGANGQDFTITYAGDLTAKFDLSGYSNPGKFYAELIVKSLILNGKTTVG